MDPIVITLDAWFDGEIRQASHEQVNPLLALKLALKRQMSQLTGTQAAACAVAFLSRQVAP